MHIMLKKMSPSRVAAPAAALSILLIAGCYDSTKKGDDPYDLGSIECGENGTLGDHPVCLDYIEFLYECFLSWGNDHEESRSAVMLHVRPLCESPDPDEACEEVIDIMTCPEP